MVVCAKSHPSLRHAIALATQAELYCRPGLLGLAKLFRGVEEEGEPLTLRLLPSIPGCDALRGPEEHFPPPVVQQLLVKATRA